MSVRESLSTTPYPESGLNKDWINVGPGDFIWLRAFCPQACIATGTGPFRYLLYKDVNRHPALVLK